MARLERVRPECWEFSSVSLMQVLQDAAYFWTHVFLALDIFLSSHKGFSVLFGGLFGAILGQLAISFRGYRQEQMEVEAVRTVLMSEVIYNSIQLAARRELLIDSLKKTAKNREIWRSEYIPWINSVSDIQYGRRFYAVSITSLAKAFKPEQLTALDVFYLDLENTRDHLLELKAHHQNSDDVLVPEIAIELLRLMDKTLDSAEEVEPFLKPQKPKSFSQVFPWTYKVYQLIKRNPK